MALDIQTTKKLAELAKLEFNNEELIEIQRDLEQMIGFVEKLNEIDTSHVEPLTHITEGENTLREDEVKESIDIETTLKNAPASRDRFFTVPKVIKK
jgi:aspartyl-tRNA(Asn)/glutamyl-tRNA(Gln) amidotransferase subunit C